MKNILGYLAVCFCLGIIYVYLFKIVFWPCYILGVVVITACVLLINKELGFDILLLVLFFILGALNLKNSYTTPNSDISRYVYCKNSTSLTVKGFVNSRPVIKNGRVSFVFRTEELQFKKNNYKTRGNILVNTKNEKNLSYGEELILFGNLYRPYRLSNRGVPVAMRIKNNSALVRLHKNKGRLIKRLAFYLKDNAESVFMQHLSPLAASINNAMILGEKKHIPAVVYDYMIKSGTVHIMVVSGFHTGVIVFISGIFLKILRIPRKVRYFGIMFCLILYCLITGASTPVVRATVMGIFLVTGYFFQRDPDIKNSLSLAVFFILIINPKDFFSVSFQLSFVSVAAIAYVYPCLRSFFKTEKIKMKFLRVLFEGCLVSLAAWVGTAGFIAYYFQIFSPVTLLANMFILPLSSLIILSGLSMVIVSIILPSLSGSFVAFNEVSVFILLKLNSLLIKLPYAYHYF